MLVNMSVLSGLQQLRVEHSDRPVGPQAVRGLVASPRFKRSRELLYFIPGAHILEGERDTCGVITKILSTRDEVFFGCFFTFLTSKSS